MRAWLPALAVLAGCGGSSLPAPADLYGDWTAVADGQTRGFHFAAADDGSHAELAGMADIYVLTSEPTGDPAMEVQTGTFAIDRVPLTDTGGGVADALVSNVVSGAGAGSMFANRLVDWSGDAFTIGGTSSSTGQLTFTRD